MLETKIEIEWNETLKPRHHNQVVMIVEKNEKREIKYFEDVRSNSEFCNDAARYLVQQKIDTSNGINKMTHKLYDDEFVNPLVSEEVHTEHYIMRRIMEQVEKIKQE